MDNQAFLPKSVWRDDLTGEQGVDKDNLITKKPGHGINNPIISLSGEGREDYNTVIAADTPLGITYLSNFYFTTRDICVNL
jgi:hypothetical protein